MKRSLLIVDDEELIRKGLIARLDYLGFAFDAILEACSGEEALEAVKGENVSIVITDIRMPHMDGLDFISKAKEINPRLRFMILSGYPEFDYAKRALHLGVTAYLLKPISNDDLRNELDRLLKEMEKDAAISQGINKKNKLEKKNLDYSLEKEVNALLHQQKGEGLDRKKYPLFCKKIPESSKGWLLLGIISIDEKSCENHFAGEDMDLIRFTVKNVFEEITSACKMMMVNHVINKKRMYAVFWTGSQKDARLRHEVEGVFLEMRAVLEKMGIYLTMGASRQTRELSETTLSEAEAALRQRLVHGNSNLYFQEDATLFEANSFPSWELQSLEGYLRQGSLNGVNKMLARLFSDGMVQKCGVTYIRILWVRILNLLLKYYEPEIRKHMGIEDLLSSFRTLDKLGQLDVVRQFISNTIAECINNSAIQDASSRNKIYLAAQYIHKHYNENLSVNDLAELYSMSPNYFSSRFKKELGQSAMNYITQIRVKKAREHLESTDLSVMEIAEQVGYEDSQYFFRVFKKTTGMTPLQYRQSHRLPK